MSTPVNMPQSGAVPTPQPGPAPTDSTINALAGQIKTMVDAASAGAVQLLQATVVATALTATPPTVSVNLAGSTVQVDGVSFFDGYTPAVSDNVDVLKQDNAIVIIGHVVDTGTATATTAGWQTPVLSTGYTTNGNSNGAIQYRYVLDNGAPKVQWQGSVAHSGTNTPIISGGNVLAALYRPGNKVSKITSRDPGGGSNDVGIDFGTDGSVTLTGGTTGGTSGTTGSTGIADTDSVDPPDVTTSENPGPHVHGVLNNHSHPMSASGHTHTTGTTVTNPVWVSFNGIEYFL